MAEAVGFVIYCLHLSLPFLVVVLQLVQVPYHLVEVSLLNLEMLLIDVGDEPSGVAHTQ